MFPKWIELKWAQQNMNGKYLNIAIDLCFIHIMYLKLKFGFIDGALDSNALPNKRTRTCPWDIKIARTILLVGCIL